MAKVKIQGHASGTGILTVTAPNTSTDRTITLPDATGTLSVDKSITDNGNATAMTIGADENIGVGVVPEAWHSSGVALQVGAGGTVHAHTTDERIAIISNAYEAAADGNWYHNVSGLSGKITLDNGTILYQTAATGSADSAVSWTTLLDMKADGRGLSQFTAKAWCNMNQSGTQAIQDSHNISSIQDDGTGLTRFTFTNNMGNVNYAGSLCSNWNAAQGLENTSVSYVESAIGALSGGYVDKDDVTLIIFGD